MQPIRCLALLVTLLMLPPPLEAEASLSPQEHLRTVSEQLLGQIRSRTEEFEANEQALYDYVHDTLGPVLDYDRISTIVLGRKGYQAASPEQRKAFIFSLQKQLVVLYAKTILTYSDGNIRYLPFEMKPDKSYQVVKTEFILSGRAPVDLSYLMRQVDGHWRVFEVRADGIFLIKSLRDSLRPEIDENGLDAVIERLQQSLRETSRSPALHAFA